MFSNIQSGNRLPKSKLIDGDIPYVIAKTTNNGIYKKISKSTQDYSGNPMKLFDAPAITISIDNPRAIYLQNSKFFTSNIMRVLQVNDMTIEQYVFYLNVVRGLATGFDWSTKFSGPVLKSQIVNVPNIKEQKQIGSFFNQLDTLITLQQRLTSLTLLLKALADVDEQDRDEIEEEYLTNKYLDDNNHLKLKPVEHDYEAFCSVMNNMVGFDQASKVIDNYNYFRKLIKDSEINSAELYEAMNHFNMVYIELSSDANEENPQVIFESLNSTGVSLSSSDLVRNFLLMKLDSQKQAELYKKYLVKIERMFATKTFAEFIRHYLIVKTHVSVKRNGVYNSYKDYFLSQGLSSEDALADLFKSANYYDQILNHKANDNKFNKILEHINVMDSKVVFPYLMLLMNLLDDGETDQVEVNNLAHILESYLFRLKVCQMPTNGLNKIVVGLCDLSKENGNLKFRLLRLLKANFPDDRKLLDSLMEVDLYRQRNDLAKLSLIVLEEHRTRETINFDDAQVEHIMPQCLNAEWRLQVTNADKMKEQYGGTLGNLTLTKYNQ